MAQKKKATGKKDTFVIGARPHLSRKALKQLEAMEPDPEALERVKNMVQLKVVDGATCGF